MRPLLNSVNLRVFAATAALVALTASCPEQPISVTVTLRGVGDFNPDDVECLKVIVRTADPMPSVFGPFERSASTQTRLGATVMPGQTFTIDVQGCPGIDGGSERCTVEACTDETILVDGCWGPGVIENNGEGVTIDVGDIDLTPPCPAPAP